MSLSSIFADIGGFFTGADKEVSTVATDLGVTAGDVQKFWGIALGIAEVAEVVDPTISPLIASAMAIAGPIVADIEAGLADAQHLVTLADEAIKLQIAAGPSFKAVASTP